MTRALLGPPGPPLRPPEHREDVGERTYAAQSASGSRLLSELESLPETREPFLGAAEVDEVTAHEVAPPELWLVCADRTSDLQRSLHSASDS